MYRLAARLLPIPLAAVSLLGAVTLLEAVLLRSEAPTGSHLTWVRPASKHQPGRDSTGAFAGRSRFGPRPPARRLSAVTRVPEPATLEVSSTQLTEPAPALPPEVRTVIPDANLMQASDSIPGLESTLFELQLGRLARRILRGYWVEDQLLLSLSDWLDFAQLAHEESGSRITGRMEPSKARFTIDAASGVARLGSEEVSRGSQDVRVVEGVSYASLPLISRMFGVTTTVDRDGATVLVHNPEHLPIARRMRRDAARGIQIGSERPLSPGLIHRTAGRGRSGLVVAYEVRASSQNPLATTSYDFGLGSGVAQGSAVLRARGTAEEAPHIEGAWSRVWLDQRWLSQLRLGDGPTSGPRPSLVRGVSLSNVPVHRAILVEDLPFAGTLPPDWSIEAYREGRLVGFDSVDASGRYSLTFPMHYGENPVDFVAYGPFGEIRTFNRTFRALPSMVPAGMVEYGASAGACRFAPCQGMANFDFRYGASRRWTLRAGLDRVWGVGQGSIFHPYAGVVAAPINSVGLEVEQVADLLRRVSLRLEPSVRLRLTGDYVAYADSGSWPLFRPAGTREQWSLYGRYMPGRRVGAMVVEAQATRTLTGSGMRAEERVGAALQVENTVVRPYFRAQRVPGAAGPVRESFVGLQATVLPVRALGPVLGGFWLQGQAETVTGGPLASASVVISRNLGGAFRIEGGTRWERGLRGPILTFSLVSQLAAVRSASLLTAQAGEGPARLDQSIAGSVVWTRGSKALALSSDPSLDRSGVGGQVFLDLNGNARRDPEEPVLPGTRLLVANRWVSADSAGRYQVWGLSPYEEILISTDTTSLSSPWWVPRFAAQGVTPTPNLVQSADVVIDIGGVIEGSLVLDGPTSRPLNRPIPIVLTESGSGTRTIVESFTDGSFYRMGLRPGRYEATIDPGVLARLKLVADTLRFELPPGRSAADAGPMLSGLRLILR